MADNSADLAQSKREGYNGVQNEMSESGGSSSGGGKFTPTRTKTHYGDTLKKVETSSTTKQGKYKKRDLDRIVTSGDKIKKTAEESYNDVSGIYDGINKQISEMGEKYKRQLSNLGGVGSDAITLNSGESQLEAEKRAANKEKVIGVVNGYQEKLNNINAKIAELDSQGTVDLRSHYLKAELPKRAEELANKISNGRSIIAKLEHEESLAGDELAAEQQRRNVGLQNQQEIAAKTEELQQLKQMKKQTEEMAAANPKLFTPEGRTASRKEYEEAAKVAREYGDELAPYIETPSPADIEYQILQKKDEIQEIVKKSDYVPETGYIGQAKVAYEKAINSLYVASEKLKKMEIDPNRHYNNMSTFTKVMAGIGSVLLVATGRPDVITKAINQAIDRDIDAQKANIEIKAKALGWSEKRVNLLKKQFEDSVGRKKDTMFEIAKLRVAEGANAANKASVTKNAIDIVNKIDERYLKVAGETGNRTTSTTKKKADKMVDKTIMSDEGDVGTAGKKGNGPDASQVKPALAKEYRATLKSTRGLRNLRKMFESTNPLGVAAVLGLKDEKKFQMYRDKVAFDYIKSQSGAQVSDKEIARRMKLFPDVKSLWGLIVRGDAGELELQLSKVDKMIIDEEASLKDMERQDPNVKAIRNKKGNNTEAQSQDRPETPSEKFRRRKRRRQ